MSRRHEAGYLERELDPAAARAAGRPARAPRARRRLPAGDEGRRRGLPDRGAARRGLPRGVRWDRRATTASRSSPRRRSSRSARASATEVTTRTRACSPRPIAGVRVICAYVPERPVGRLGEVRLQARVVRAPAQVPRPRVRPRARARAGRRLQRAPADLDVHDPLAWRGQVLCSEPERAALARVLDWGLVDAFRTKYPERVAFTWWDYRDARLPEEPRPAHRPRAADASRSTRGSRTS